MKESRVNGRVKRQDTRFLGRSIRVLGVGAVSAILLSACGSGPSKSENVAQDLTAGITAQNAGDYATATSYYEKVLATEPKNPTALYDLGDVDQLQNLFAAAKVKYLAALAIDPKFISAMYNLATLEANSSPNDARVLYQEIITLSPQYANAHFNLGYVLIALGQRKAGLAEINQGVKLDPSLKSRESSTTGH
jgi:tetratricopeptide (TPR) repeat protein